MRKFSLGIIIILLLLLWSMRNNKFKYWSFYIRRKWIIFWRKTLRSLKRAITSSQEQDYIMEAADNRDNSHYEEGSNMS